MADDITGYDAIEAYCGQLSYAPGETATIHVSSRAERYDLEVRRWDAHRRVSFEVRDAVGVDQPVPDDADAHGCGWPVSVEVPIGADWRSGWYLVTLTAHGVDARRALGYAAFAVRPVRPHAKALLVVATNTYQAYNNWGGRSLYTGGRQVSFRRPLARGMLVRPEYRGDADRKSPVVPIGGTPDTAGDAYQAFRWEHGYTGAMSSAGWHTYERRFVDWADAQDIDLDVAVSTDPAEFDGLLGQYPLVLSIGHDEYWSAGQRSALERYVAAGGNVVSLSGNTMFWQVRPDIGADGRAEGYTCFKYKAHLLDPVVGTPDEHLMTGMWCDPVVGRPETALFGAGSAYGLYSRFGQATPRGTGAFTVYRHDHWLFEGTGLRYGDLLGRDHGVVGYETTGCRLAFDEYQLPVAAGGDGTPPDIEVLAFTPSSNLAYGEFPASIAASDDQSDLEQIAERVYGSTGPDALRRARYGNAVMVVCRPSGPDGGEVVTVGSTDWVYGLADPAVSRVTSNAIERYCGPVG